MNALADVATTLPDPGADPGGFLGLVIKLFTDHNWLPALVVVLVGIIYVLRALGKSIPALGAALQTTVGGWILNGFTALAGVLGAAVAAGTPLTWALALQALVAAVGAAGVWEGVKDTKAATPTTPPTI